VPHTPCFAIWFHLAGQPASGPLRPAHCAGSRNCRQQLRLASPRRCMLVVPLLRPSSPAQPSASSLLPLLLPRTSHLFHPPPRNGRGASGGPSWSILNAIRHDGVQGTQGRACAGLNGTRPACPAPALPVPRFLGTARTPTWAPLFPSFHQRSLTQSVSFLLSRSSPGLFCSPSLPNSCAVPTGFSCVRKLVKQVATPHDTGLRLLGPGSSISHNQVPNNLNP